MTLKTVVLVLALCAGPVGAQTVWRCGNSYSQQPCAGGTAVTVSDPVTGRPAATPVANVDAKLAAEMEKARLAQERNAPKALVIGPVEAPPLRDARKDKDKDGTKAKTGKLEQFTAVSAGHPKEKKAKAKKKKKAA